MDIDFVSLSYQLSKLLRSFDLKTDLCDVGMMDNRLLKSFQFVLMGNLKFVNNMEGLVKPNF